MLKAIGKALCFRPPEAADDSSSRPQHSSGRNVLGRAANMLELRGRQQSASSSASTAVPGWPRARENVPGVRKNGETGNASSSSPHDNSSLGGFGRLEMGNTLAESSNPLNSKRIAGSLTSFNNSSLGSFSDRANASRSEWTRAPLPRHIYQHQPGNVADQHPRDRESIAGSLTSSSNSSLGSFSDRAARPPRSEWTMREPTQRHIYQHRTGTVADSSSSSAGNSHVVPVLMVDSFDDINKEGSDGSSGSISEDLVRSPTVPAGHAGHILSVDNFDDINEEGSDSSSGSVSEDLVRSPTVPAGH